jgi:small-conductance mechanosensitive channel
MFFLNSIIKNLQILIKETWVHDAALLLGFSLLAYLPAWISAQFLEKVQESFAPHKKIQRLAFVLLQASAWPLWAIFLLFLGFKIWGVFFPATTGNPGRLLPILWFFLIYRILITLIKETLPSAEHRRKIQSGVISLIFILAVLQQLELLAPILSWLNHPFLTIGQTHLAVSSILIALIILGVFFLIARFAAKLLRSQFLPKLGIERSLSESLATLARYFVVAVGVIVALDSLGFDLTTLKIVLGALGVGIGFGLQNVVNNFVSGIIIIAERTVKQGDIIAVGQTDGRVIRIGLRSSVVRTRAGLEIIVPNSDFVSSQVTNFSYRDRLVRLDLPVGVSYASDPNQVRDLLLRAADEEDRVLKTPAPDVMFIQYGNSSIDFQLRVWIDDPWVSPQVRTALYFSIWYKLKEAGIEIPFPQRDLHVRSGEIKVRLDSGPEGLPPHQDQEVK